MTAAAAGTCPGCGRPFPVTRAGRRYCSEKCRDRVNAARAKALRSGRERAERIAARDREWERRHTSRGLGFDAGARRTSPVPWEGDE